MYIQWSKDYELGIEKIDTQHIKLVNIINRLDEAFRNKLHEDTINFVFQGLIDYCNYHFKFEETLMSSCKYDNLLTHTDGHETFKRNINNFQLEYHNGNSYALKMTLDYLNNWLIDHIMVEDRKYVPSVKPGRVVGVS